MSTSSTSTPNRPKYPPSWMRVEPYAAIGATTRSPARSTDASAAWMAAIPDASARPASAAGELRVGGAERGRRGVGEPAVGVPGARVRGDDGERLGVGGGERRRLEDRDGGRAAGGPRASADAARIARVASPQSRGARRRAVDRSGWSWPGCYTGGSTTPARVARRAPAITGTGADALGCRAGDAVPPGSLGRVHRLVGADHQGVGRGAVARIRDDADRDGRANGEAGDLARRRRPAGSSRRGPSRRSDRSREAAPTNSSPP